MCRAAWILRASRRGDLGRRISEGRQGLHRARRRRRDVRSIRVIGRTRTVSGSARVSCNRSLDGRARDEEVDVVGSIRVHSAICEATTQSGRPGRSPQGRPCRLPGRFLAIRREIGQDPVGRDDRGCLGLAIRMSFAMTVWKDGASRTTMIAAAAAIGGRPISSIDGIGATRGYRPGPAHAGTIVDAAFRKPCPIER